MPDISYTQPITHAIAQMRAKAPNIVAIISWILPQTYEITARIIARTRIANLPSFSIDSIVSKYTYMVFGVRGLRIMIFFILKTGGDNHVH